MKEHGESRETRVVEATQGSVPGGEVEWYLVGPSTDL